MLCEEGCFTLDTLVSGLLPEGDLPALQGVTLRHLLCHTSGLRDTPALDRALREGETFHAVLKSEGVRGSEPGAVMAYSNLGFGLLGCVLEKASGKSIEALFQDKLFHPLGMRATLDGSTLEERCIMPISRVLPYRKGQDVRVTRLGRIPIDQPDPLRHFGHTAGAMYTDCASLKRLLTLIHQKGVFDGKRLLSEASIREMSSNQLTPRQMETCWDVNIGYGYGYLVRTVIDETLNHPHMEPNGTFGWNGMGGTTLRIDPACGMTVVYGIQRVPANHDDFIPPILQAVAKTFRA